MFGTQSPVKGIDVVQLYFAAPRPGRLVGGAMACLSSRDDARMPLPSGPRRFEMRLVRFLSLGRYRLTGAVESEATTLAEIIAEMRAMTWWSERSDRAVDHDGVGSMEQKKLDGPFR